MVDSLITKIDQKGCSISFPRKFYNPRNENNKRIYPRSALGIEALEIIIMDG